MGFDKILSPFKYDIMKNKTNKLMMLASFFSPLA
jgi:hypothetical protein